MHVAPGCVLILHGRRHCCLLLYWQHLLPLLDRPDSWDVLITHYLGVDHAGHSYGVNSKQMQDKLAQMDEQVSTVIGRSCHNTSAPSDSMVHIAPCAL